MEGDLRDIGVVKLILLDLGACVQVVGLGWVAGVELLQDQQEGLAATRAVVVARGALAHRVVDNVAVHVGGWLLHVEAA